MDSPKSKSQLKREATALQDIGVHFTTLSLERIQALPLPDTLLKAILDAKKLKSNGARRRQAQLIGKLMRSADHAHIIQIYEQLQAEDSAQSMQFHEVEQWRERLMSTDKEALTEFINLYHPEDVQQLKNCIKKAILDNLTEKNTGAKRALFRLLRSCIS